MNIKLLLIGSIIFSFSIGGSSASNSNNILEKADPIETVQPCTFRNMIEYASFKYTCSDSFKTGKVTPPHLVLAADSLLFYKGKKYQVKLKHFDVRNAIFGVGSLSTSTSTVLLFTKEKQFHAVEVKGVGSFEFMGTKEDKYYFQLSLKDNAMYFSLSLNQPEIQVTEYTVESE